MPVRISILDETDEVIYAIINKLTQLTRLGTLDHLNIERSAT